jgi:hypothetical protein
MNASAPPTPEDEDARLRGKAGRCASGELFTSGEEAEEPRRWENVDGERADLERAREVVDGRGKGKEAVWRQPIDPGLRVTRQRVAPSASPRFLSLLSFRTTVLACLVFCFCPNASIIPV